MKNHFQRLGDNSRMWLTKAIPYRVATAVLIILLLGTTTAWGQIANQPSAGKPLTSARISVIYDTDFAGDFDDTLGLVMILKSPQFDLKLVTTTGNWRELHGKLLAKYLTVAGRTDVPIGIGGGDNVSTLGSFAQWLKSYKLSEYPGKVHQDGVGALIDTINNSPEPITILANGPMETLGAAVRRDPGIATKANLAAMIGNLNVRNKQGKLFSEQNAMQYAAGSKLVLSAPWKSITITPLDTAIVFLERRYQKFHLLETTDELLKFQWATQERFIKFWHPEVGGDFKPDGTPIFKPNGTLPFEQCQFAAVTVYLADPRQDLRFLHMEKLKIKVMDNGTTVVAPDGKEMNVAVRWQDRDAFLDYVAHVLLSDTVKQGTKQ